jgi:CheY-like chemotaxis protein
MSRKILLIEDDLSIQEAIHFVLEGEGYEVDCADNGEEAMNFLSRQKPDLIILDIMMPVMNGHQFREAQLRNGALASIPTVALTADRNFLQKKPSGFHAILKKPVELDELLNVLENTFHS